MSFFSTVGKVGICWSPPPLRGRVREGGTREGESRWCAWFFLRQAVRASVRSFVCVLAQREKGGGGEMNELQRDYEKRNVSVRMHRKRAEKGGRGCRHVGSHVPRL